MKSSSEIPRPAGSLVSHSVRFVRNTMLFYEEAFRECGDVFTTRIPGLGNWVYVCSPDLARTIFEAPPDVLAGGDIEGFSLAHLLGQGATSQLEGPAHRERRELTARYLDTQAGLRHVDDIRGIAERRLARWPLGQPFRLVLELQRIGPEALIQVFFWGGRTGHDAAACRPLRGLLVQGPAVAGLRPSHPAEGPRTVEPLGPGQAAAARAGQGVFARDRCPPFGGRRDWRG